MADEQAIIPGSPEHTAAMIAKADEAGVQMKILDSSGNVQHIASGESQPEQAPTSGEATQPAQEQPADVAESPFKAFYEEFAQTGDISAESKGKLLELTRSLKLPDEMVDTYIDGYKAKQSAAATEEQKAALVAEDSKRAGFAAAGGEQAYGQMTQWAKANMSPAEIEAFNSQVGASKEAALLAIEGLKARWSRATGQQPGRTLQGGSAGDGSASQPFADQAEMSRAMRDPRYASSAAYRAQIAQRLSLTSNGALGVRVR